MFDRLEKIKERYDQVTGLLSEPAVISDQETYRVLRKEHSDLYEIVEAYGRYKRLEKDIEGNKEIAQTAGDAELRELAQAELEELEAKRKALEEQLKILLVPQDPNDSKNVIVEIRAGTGGGEAALFAADLFECTLAMPNEKGGVQR